MQSSANLHFRILTVYVKREALWKIQGINSSSSSGPFELHRTCEQPCLILAIMSSREARTGEIDQNPTTLVSLSIALTHKHTVQLREGFDRDISTTIYLFWVTFKRCFGMCRSPMVAFQGMKGAVVLRSCRWGVHFGSFRFWSIFGKSDPKCFKARLIIVLRDKAEKIDSSIHVV